MKFFIVLLTVFETDTEKATYIGFFGVPGLSPAALDDHSGGF